MLIRLLEIRDHEAVASILEPVVRDGTTYAVPMQATREQILAGWLDGKRAVYVAELEGRVVGTFYLRSNQPGNGDHVGNAGYAVLPEARGQGVASAMCRFSLNEAKRLGYQAMQFNFVIETNTGAVRLWQKHGFRILTTIPEAFRHPEKGLVGAHVMHRSLHDLEEALPSSEQKKPG